MATKIQERRLLIYVPEGDGPHPVLCFLHGLREGGKDLRVLLKNNSPAWHAEEASPFASRFLVVCPQLETERRWGTDADVAMVDAVVAAAINRHRGDSGHLVLTGFSTGGEGAFQIAASSRHPWSTIWAVDPALQRVPPVPAEHVRVWVHHGSRQPGANNMDDFGAKLGLKRWAETVENHRVKTRLYVDHGGTCNVAYQVGRVYEWAAPPNGQHRSDRQSGEIETLL